MSRDCLHSKHLGVFREVLVLNGLTGQDDVLIRQLEAMEKQQQVSVAKGPLLLQLHLDYLRVQLILSHRLNRLVVLAVKEPPAL